MKTIVFDFDKTLTNYDTMTAFLLYGMKKNKIMYVFIPFVLFLKIIAKFKIITIKYEKEILTKLLLPTEANRFEEICISFSKTIILNNLIANLEKAKQEGHRVIILSASPETYIKALFPDIEVFGTTFVIVNGYLKRIKQHPYGKEKQIVLMKNDIIRIDTFYYDSKSDEVLLPICESYAKVYNGKIIQSVNL